jgi:L-iditol 2-dehydrogenase
VLERARDGSGPEKGTRVAVEPGIPCRRCALCKSGRYNLCRDVVFMSAPPVNGTFAERAAVASDFLHPLPDGVSDEEGALVEPLAVGIQACTRGRLAAGDTVAILGAGPIGLVIFLVARAFGAAGVFVVDVLDERLAFARSLGADGAVNPRSGDAVAAIMEATRGLGADIVFDASGASAASATAPLLAARGGRVVLVGWPEAARFPWPVETVIDRELDVAGVNRYCNAFPRALALLSHRRIDAMPLVTQRFPFEGVCDAFAYALSHRASTMKVLVGAP